MSPSEMSQIALNLKPETVDASRQYAGLPSTTTNAAARSVFM
ncbi:MAG TPA: hypothetical protein VJA26_17115 [Gammaproteobacteria bacterium]|nr:hypothetical protein [Gammaproteobacteria bacterium]